MQCARNVAGHGDVDVAEFVVPCEGEAAVEGACPINGDGVKELECVDEVLSMMFADVLDAEVVNDESEGDRAFGVGEETGSVLSGDVAVLGKVGLEASVGEYAGLWEAVHAHADFNHDHVVVDKGRKIVLVHDVGWDEFDGDPHVFELGHWRTKVKVLDVNRHVLRVGSGDDAV